MSSGEMAILLPRRPPHEDVTKIPTPPLQAAGLFINFFFPALALVIVSLRFYSRISMRQWGADDYMIGIAMICSLLMCGPFYIYMKLNYFGWRAVDVPEFDPAPGKWWFYLAQLFYNPVLALVKASVLLFLHRLGGQKPGVRYAIWGIFIFNALQAIAIFLVALLQCLPIKANWDAAAMANATCVDNSFHITISCLTILTDILVLGLPFWIFLGLKMPMASKIAVIGVFMIGISVTVVGIVRLVDVYKLFYVQSATADPFHTISITLNSVEVNLAIISASIPALRPLFRTWLPSVFGSSKSRYGASKRSPLPLGNGYYGSRTGGARSRTATRNSITLKNMHPTQTQKTECLSLTPYGSDEEILTSNGIIKSTQVQVQFDGQSVSSDMENVKETRRQAQF